MEKKLCHLSKKLESNQKLTSEDVKLIMQIVRKQMSFMIKNNIIITPKNYERWFNIFCHIIENHKELNDLEILGLFKQYYNTPYDEVKKKSPEDTTFQQSGTVHKLVKIADAIEKKLTEVIATITNHNENISTHQEEIFHESEHIENEEIKYCIKKILDELKMLRKENSVLTEKLRRYHENVIRLQDELITAKTEAEIDFLTGLVNRRRFERAILEMNNEYQTRSYPFALILMDIDNFKKINDTYGHPVGDHILKEMALILKTFLRASNVSARIGGEEFAILVPGATIQEGEIVAERLRKAISNRIFNAPDNEIRVTASFGVTSVRKDDTLETIFARVDKALYQAKHTGKNRVVVIE